MVGGGLMVEGHGHAALDCQHQSNETTQTCINNIISVGT